MRFLNTNFQNFLRWLYVAIFSLIWLRKTIFHEKVLVNPYVFVLRLPSIHYVTTAIAKYETPY